MYNLSTTVDPNKIFLIQRSELEERLDSTSYRPSFSFTSAKFRIEKLIKVAQINPKVSFDKLVKGSEISFVPMEVINEFNGRISEERFKKVEESKGFTRFTENDLIWAKITPCMQNGKSAVARNLKQGVACGSTEFFVIRPKSSDELLVDYIHFLLRDERVLKDAQNYFGGSAGQQRVSSEFLRNFKIPIPPIDVQHKIVGIINNAYAAKQQKEAEAKALLESIDTYLLGELGISLEDTNQTFYFQEPTPRYGIHYKIQKDYELNETNKLVQEGKIFLTNFSEVSGGRYDPKLYDHNTKGLKRAIENNHFKNELLKNLITQSAAGDWGKDENEVLGNDFTKCLVIRATEFDNQYNLRLDNSRVKYRWIHKDKLARIDIKENDLLIEKSGGSPDQPVGRIAIIKKNMVEKNQLCYSNFIHKIRVDTSKVNPKYLFYLLKTFHNIKLTDSMQSQTNGIRNLIMREYFNQTIPLPFAEDPEKSLKKQTEIANHIQSIRSRAKALQHEATRVLEEAKREVEKMILGE